MCRVVFKIPKQISRKLNRVGINYKLITMSISDVQLKNSYLQVFGENGKKISEIHNSHGDLCGIASNFYILEKSNYYVTYDANSKKIAEIHNSHGEFKGAAGSTFNLIKNSYIVSYDAHCKKTGERHV
jgi:hypothetical protein